MNSQTDHFTGRIARARTALGPLSLLNPTTRFLPVEKPTHRQDASARARAERNGGSGSGALEPTSTRRAEDEPKSDGRDSAVYHVWRSRDNRKGRHAVVASPEFCKGAGAAGPKATNTLKETLRGLGKMVVRYPVWDVSYDVATVFTLGSAVWVINGFFVWLPLQVPGSEFPGESSVGGGWTAWVGATVFELGSVLLMLEAVNDNRADCFGWALEEALESRETLVLAPASSRGGGGGGGCRHSHAHRGAFLRGKPGRGGDGPEEEGGEGEGEGEEEDCARPWRGRRWQWWSSWYELRTHYLRDIGFLACLSQMIGATVFWISGFTGLPQILGVLSVPTENGIYWLPQVVGGTGFIISSILFMLETQRKWYIPAPKLLGWHVGFWNLIGALGFTLCGALGFAIDVEGAEYASTLSTFIGSWAFLIGSLIQWYESLDKYPISIENAPSGMSKS